MNAMRSATVIIPTFDHGPIIRSAIVSAQKQTVTDLEIVVVGDGAPDSTIDLVSDMSKGDSRIRGVWNPKGERLGELHRNEILEICTTSAICYLSDDDLWSPLHIEAMLEALQGVDFAHSNHLFLTAEQTLHPVAVSFELPQTRQSELDGLSFIGLSVLGHTTAAAQDRGLRWHLTPKNRYTDWHFITGALNMGLTFGSTKQVTVLNLAGVFRHDWDSQRRLAEIEEWLPRVSSPQWTGLVEQTLVSQLSNCVELQQVSTKTVDLMRAELDVAHRSLVAAKQLEVSQSSHLEKATFDLGQNQLTLEYLRDTHERLLSSRAVRLQQRLSRSRIFTTLWRLTK